jgi:hypothetical protein
MLAAARRCGGRQEFVDIGNQHDRKLDELATGLADLRANPTHFHASVLGHGVMIGEIASAIRISIRPMTEAHHSLSERMRRAYRVTFAACSR